MFLLSSPVAPVSKCNEAIPTIWQWHPPVGVFIALLAVVGVLVPWFRGEAKPREKAFWTFLMFLFVGLEIRTIYLDQAQHDREQALARCQQLESFHEIANGITGAITQSQQQFEKTMSASNLIVGKVADAINVSTGGRSFAFINYVPGQSSMAIFHNGAYPLYGVSARIWNAYNSSEQTIDIRDSGNLGGPDSESPPKILSDVTNDLRVKIFFKARNATWVEWLYVTKVDDNWKRALAVSARFSPKDELKVVCGQIDSDFPFKKERPDNDFPVLNPMPPPCL